MKIDKIKFSNNLKLTQHYCINQLPKDQINIPEVLRAYNPINNGVPLFFYEKTSSWKKGINDILISNWQIDPLKDENKNLIPQLFEDQMLNKKLNSKNTNQELNGNILVTDFDYTIIDGASEQASLGLIDAFDLPPIDTWFYLSKGPSRTLYSWIPDEFISLFDQAIAVNPLDIIRWISDGERMKYFSN